MKICGVLIASAMVDYLNQYFRDDPLKNLIDEQDTAKLRQQAKGIHKIKDCKRFYFIAFNQYGECMTREHLDINDESIFNLMFKAWNGIDNDSDDDIDVTADDDDVAADDVAADDDVDANHLVDDNIEVTEDESNSRKSYPLWNHYTWQLYWLKIPTVEWEGKVKNLSLYHQKQFAKHGYSAASILVEFPLLQMVLDETEKDNLLVQACYLYINCEVFIAELQALSYFTHKVTLPSELCGSVRPISFTQHTPNFVQRLV